MNWMASFSTNNTQAESMSAKSSLLSVSIDCLDVESSVSWVWLMSGW